MVDGKDGSPLPPAWERGHDCDGLCELRGPARYGSPGASGLRVVGGYFSVMSTGSYSTLGHPIH